MRKTVAVIAVLLAFGRSSVAAAEDPLFPFVVSYDSPDNVTNISAWLTRPAGKHGFVRDRDGQLATDAGRIRFWGTNICFEGCFPAHEQAERVAARLARLGINCVRMHHIDWHSIWGDSPNHLKIDPKKLERLDYFIHRLKLHGIYVNLNMHVSRWFDDSDGFPAQEQRPEFDKGLDQFEPRMIALQKQFARDLLTHVNPYTKTAYTDEPAVAFVEISNEDGLFAQWSSGNLDRLPEPYSTTYRKLWNVWLRRKYGDTEKLRAAWGTGATPKLGQEMLRNGNFAQPLYEGWQVERDAQTQADVSVEPGKPGDASRSLQVAVTESGRDAWNPQLVQAGLRVERGAAYTLSFRLRRDKPGQCEVQCQMAHPPWRPLGLAARVEAKPEWKQHRFTFVATADDDARVIFTQFQEGTAFELADVSLRPGGVVGLDAAARLENDSVPPLRGLSPMSAARNDFCDFLQDTERNYWQTMYRFLKDDLHVRSLVCGTQLGFSTIHIQAALDYVDNHAYWQHPHFPNRPWDSKDWHIEDAALVNSPGGTLAQLAVERVAGKAYTVSEYNHPSPNSYAAEGFPMIASFGAFQNWDGIYSFGYTHDQNFETRKIGSFFDIKSHTAQLVHAPACVAMFVRGDVASAARPTFFRFSRKDERRQLHETGTAWNLTAQGLLDDMQYPLIHATALDLSDRGENDANKVVEGRQGLSAGRFISDTGQICWDISQRDAGYYTVNSPRSKLFTGFVRGRTFPLGELTLEIGPTRLDWATVSMTVIDGEGFDQPGRILVAATGWVQNRGAEPERLQGNRITLRDRWGAEPVLCEGIRATVAMPVAPERVKCYPLDESGNRREAISIGASEGKARIVLGPQYKTVWYEVEIGPSR